MTQWFYNPLFPPPPTARLSPTHAPTVSLQLLAPHSPSCPYPLPTWPPPPTPLPYLPAPGVSLPLPCPCPYPLSAAPCAFPLRPLGALTPCSHPLQVLNMVCLQARLDPTGSCSQARAWLQRSRPKGLGRSSPLLPFCLCSIRLHALHLEQASNGVSDPPFFLLRCLWGWSPTTLTCLVARQ